MHERIRRQPADRRTSAPARRVEDERESSARDTGGPPLTPSARVLRMQRTAGNIATTRALHVQRHADGTELPDKAELVDTLGSAQAGSAGKKPAAVTRTDADEATAKQGAKGAGATFNKTGPNKAMSLGAAESILTGAYGGITKIAPGKIELVATREKLWELNDEVNIRDAVNNDSTGKPWAKGDAKKEFPGLEGFADDTTATVYVFKNTSLVTATAHEILHNNAAPNFRYGVGEVINEGCTEYLAKKALNEAGVATPKGKTAYETNVAIVEALVAFVGEQVVVESYFAGPKALKAAYEKKQGENMWAELKRMADELDVATIKEILK